VFNVFWPEEYKGAVLEHSGDPQGPWTSFPESAVTNRLIFPWLEGHGFFRLKLPVIPTFGLVADYPLNGNALDSVGGHHGTVHGAYPTSNRLGNGSSAMAFEGAGYWIEIPSHPDFSVSTTGQFSISVWIRPGALTFPDSEGGPNQNDYAYFMGKGQSYGTSGDQEWACRMYNLGNSENRPNWISFYIFNPEGHLGSGSRIEDSVTTQVWIHLVGTVDVAADTIKWYKNGVLRDVDTLSSFGVTPRAGNAPVRLGTMNFDSSWIGSIDNLRFYNRVLSPLEVEQLHREPTR